MTALRIMLTSVIVLAGTACCFHANAATGEHPIAATGAQPEAVSIRAPWMPGKSNFLQGESAVADYPIYVTASEAARAGFLQVAFDNSVSILPEASLLQIWVNDRQVGEMNLRGGDRQVISRLRMPPGLLIAGLNSIRFHVQTQHRVDCSPAATYELWTKIDLAKTGLVIPVDTQVSSGARPLEDLLGINLANDGTTRIRIRSKSDLSSRDAERMAGIVQAIERNLRLPDPIVSVEAAAMEGSGLEIIAGSRSDLADVGADYQASGLYIDGTKGRARIVITGETDADVATAMEGLTNALDRVRPVGSQSGEKAWRSLQGYPVDGAGVLTFAEAGLSEPGFRGRQFDRTISLSLPESLTAGAFEKVVLRLKGEVPGGLLPGSVITARVNGVGSGSLRIDGANAMDLEGQRVDIPFQLFHAGTNTVSFDATMTTASDRTCESTTEKLTSSFRIGGDSTIEFPSFTHLRSGPNVARELTGRTSSERPRHFDMVLLRPDNPTIASGLTILANQAANGNASSVSIKFGAQSDMTGTGMVIGQLADFPTDLAVEIKKSSVGTDQIGGQQPLATKLAAAQDSFASSGPMSTQSDKPVSIQVISDANASSGVLRWANWAIRGARSLGFEFADTTARQRLVLRDGSILIGEYNRSVKPTLVAGVALPSVSVSDFSWLLFSADSTDALNAGLGEMVKSGQWGNLSGQFAAFDPSSSLVSAIEPDRHFYLMSKDWHLEDLPMIVATIISDYVGLYVCIMLLLISTLCFVTWRLIKRVGVNT